MTKNRKTIAAYLTNKNYLEEQVSIKKAELEDANSNTIHFKEECEEQKNILKAT